MEEWRDIPWYEGRYRVSNKKRVFSLCWFWRILDGSCFKPYKVTLHKNWERERFKSTDLYREAFNITEEEIVEKKEKGYNYDVKEYILFRYWKKLEEICNKHNLLFKEEVQSQRRDKYMQQCRYECYKYLRGIWITEENIWVIFWRTHWAISYTLKTYGHKNNTCKV